MRSYPYSIDNRAASEKGLNRGFSPLKEIRLASTGPFIASEGRNLLAPRGGLGPSSPCPYSPKCLVEDFCELRSYGVLGSSSGYPSGASNSKTQGPRTNSPSLAGLSSICSTVTDEWPSNGGVQ
jgi:hypothetical protein